MRRIRAGFKIRPADAVSAFLGALPCQSDEFAQVAVAIPVHGQADQPQSILQYEFAANEKMQAEFFGFGMGSYDPGHRTFIREGQCGITQVYSVLDQFFRHGGAFQETETGAAMKLGVGRRSGRSGSKIHGRKRSYPNNPCKDQVAPLSFLSSLSRPFLSLLSLSPL